MGEVRERYGRIADDFGRRVTGVGDNQWDAPTPCPDWSVRDLVAHVVGTHLRVVADVSDAPLAEVDPDRDLVARWQVATEAITAALDDAGRASTTVRGMFGEQSFESLVGRLLCADTLFHTWDLARATGQDERLDRDAAAQALTFLEPLDDTIRVPGGFGPKLDPPPGADEQARFLAFGGRAG